MNYDFSESHRILQAEMGKFCSEEIAPLADTFLVLAWTDRDVGLEKGLSLILVNREAEGMTIGKPVETMGLRGAPTAGIRLENCRVTDEAPLLGGTAGAGWGQRQAILEEIKLGVSAMCVGIGMACTEEAPRMGVFHHPSELPRPQGGAS